MISWLFWEQQQHLVSWSQNNSTSFIMYVKNVTASDNHKIGTSRISYQNMLCLDKFCRTVGPGNKVDIHTKSAGPPHISNDSTPANRVPVLETIRNHHLRFCYQCVCIALFQFFWIWTNRIKTHPRPKTKSNVLPSDLLFSSTASSESSGSSALTKPEVITMRPLACSWLSAIIVPSEKYLVSLFIMSWVCKFAVSALLKSAQTGKDL